MARDGYLELASYLSPTEAGMARELLASAEIDAEVEDDAVTSVNPLLQLAVGGVKLLVEEKPSASTRWEEVSRG